MVKVFELLRQTSSISVVSGYLKAKKLTHSAGSWDELFKKRVEPAYSENKISLDELTELLRNAEESGRQHVFLFEADKDVAKSLIDQSSVMQKLAQKGLAHVAAAPLLVTEAPTAQIVDVRWSDGRLVVKIVAQRTVQELTSTVQNADGTVDRHYALVHKRVVHLFRLSPSGMLELRIASHSSGTRYTEDISMLRGMVDFLLPQGSFKLVNLRKAKEYIWANEAALSKRIRLLNSLMRNDDGIALNGFSISDGGNLSESESAKQSLNLFRGKDGYCDGLIFGLLPQGDPPMPAKEIRVLLQGMLNEFAIPSKCSHVEFEHILDEIRAFNA
jgi:hypothetical protein